MNPYNNLYDQLPNNIKTFVDLFHSDHVRLTGNIEELVKIYEKFPLPQIPDVIKCAKNIEYELMYKVHIQILGKCLDEGPTLFKGIMEVY